MWGFFGGAFKVLIPDNLTPVVPKADALTPRFSQGWLDYAHVGFGTDPARVRPPQAKGVADHERVWAWHQTIADPDHAQAGKVLRQLHDRASARAQGGARGRGRGRTRGRALRPVGEPRAEIAVEQRRLADYDTVFGIQLGLDLDLGGLDKGGLGGSEGGCAWFDRSQDHHPLGRVHQR